MRMLDWHIGIVWSDGSTAVGDHLYYEKEASAREAYGALKMAIEGGVDMRTSDNPMIITVKDDTGSELKLFGPLIRVLRFQHMDWAAEQASVDEVNRRRAYAEERGRAEYHREREAALQLIEESKP